ncbi:retrotransposon protein, putative, ty1-copia subclass [Tanacetum coccineum]
MILNGCCCPKHKKYDYQPIGPAPNLETADLDTIDKYYKTVNLEQEVACLMLSSMYPNLQRTSEKYNAFDMMKELKTMFEEQAKLELFETVKAFHACKQEDGQSVSSYLLKMKSYLDTLECLGYMIVELHAILKLNEKGIPKKAETPVVLAIREGKIQKDKKIQRGAKGKDKGKTKLAYAPKPKIPPPPKRDNPKKDSICHYCNEGLRESRKLKHGALSLQLYFAPTVTRDVVSISRLVKNGYHTFTNYGIFVSKDNVFYFNAIPRDGIYELDMHNLYPNVSSMFNVSNKRAKQALDSSYLWHCHLGHINKKRMDKLQHDGILQPTHDESLNKYKSCISGKMASYPKETMGYYFYYPLENKIFVARNAEFFENNLIVQEASGSHGLLKSSGSDEGLKLIQEEDTRLSENTSKEHNEVAPTELEAINMEMKSIKDNQVWILVDLPPDGRTVRSKWLFKKKTDMDGKVHTFKAHLVAKGYTQTYGVDYRETFSPVVDIRAIRILLAIAAYYDYEIWQMDVKFAFLNGHLSEDVYMVQPEGFVDSKHPNKVCKLQHSICELKQASRNLGEAAYILGIKIIRDRSKRLIALSQSSYLEKTLKKFRMENSKKGYTPMIEKRDYSKSQGAKTPSEVQRMRGVPYALAIGSIMYAQNPEENHWIVVKTILKYLRNTKDMVLVYGAKPEVELKVSCYADASFQTDKDDTKSQTGFQTDKDDTKSQTGYVFILNDGAVDWKSTKQSTTAMSSIEAEYIAAVEASIEAVWMRKFIDGLRGVMPSNKRPMKMVCNNEPEIAIIDDPEILKGGRQFQRKYHYIREVIQEREIVLKKVHTYDNVADLLTKPVPINRHYEHARAIGIVPASSLT